MRVELFRLLHDRPIVHPTRIEDATVRDATLRIAITGHRWWAQPAGGDDGRIVLTFTGIATGQLDLEVLLDRRWDEALDDFHVRPLGEQPWADVGPMHSLYCRAPLSDPLAVYAIVHDLLLTARAPYRAGHYLNGGERLDRFRRLTAGSDYLLSTAPSAMHAPILSEVERQGVASTVLTQVRGASTQLFVMLGDGSFICDEAWAEWEA